MAKKNGQSAHLRNYTATQKPAKPIRPMEGSEQYAMRKKIDDKRIASELEKSLKEVWEL
jgi:hypothetical protein